MECNRLCSLCSTYPAQQFCICSNLPLLCCSCRPNHETKPGFHFALPIAGIEYVTPHNQSKYRMWLVCLETSHEKLRGNLLQIDQFREEIETAYAQIHTEFEKTKGQLLHTLSQVKVILTSKIEEAVKETSENAYLDYQPSTHLASLIWAHSSQQSSESIPALTCQVTANMESLQDLLSVSFDTSIPEIASLSTHSRIMDFKQEITELQAKLEEKVQREAVLIAHSQGLEIELRLLKSHLEVQTSPLDISNSAEYEGNSRAEKRERGPSQNKEIVKKHAKMDNSQSKSPNKPEASSDHQAPISANPLSSLASLPTMCQTCQQPFTVQDKDWQCVNHCFCKGCTIAAIIARKGTFCESCKAPFSIYLRGKVLREWECCGSCGIDYPQNQDLFHCCSFSSHTERNKHSKKVRKRLSYNRYRCLACFTISPTLPAPAINCSICNAQSIVPPEVYNQVKEMPENLQERACCVFEVGTIPYKKLRCGHLVCCGHVRSLLRCRVCHQPAILAED